MIPSSWFLMISTFPGEQKGNDFSTTGAPVLAPRQSGIVPPAIGGPSLLKDGRTQKW